MGRLSRGDDRVVKSLTCGCSLLMVVVLPHPHTSRHGRSDWTLTPLNRHDDRGDRPMARPVTLFTGQWADMPLEEICKKASAWGYDGIELPCWGDHFNVQKALKDDNYCKERHDLLGRYGLKCWAISNHLVGQLVLDILDERTDDWVPTEIRGNSEKKRAWAIQEMKDTARAAKKLGVKVVNGFTGSSIWHLLYSFPPVPDKTISDGYKLL